MKRLSSAARLSIGLVFLTISVVLLAQTMGLITDPSRAELNTRRKISEAIAVQCAVAAKDEDMQRIGISLWALIERNDEVLSAGLRAPEGHLLITAGEHEKHWQLSSDASTRDQFQVPLFHETDEPFGSLEICFKPIRRRGLIGWLTDPSILLVAFIAIAGFVAYFVYLRRMLRHLDPSAVIPERVKAMLDTLAEGVLVLDSTGRIVLANNAFANVIERSIENLQGKKASDFDWIQPENNKDQDGYPWDNALKTGITITGLPLRFKNESDEIRTFIVNAAPIMGADGKRRGVLVTFDDMTSVEQKNDQLRQMLEELEQSRDEIDRQNRELQYMATHDALTGLPNRAMFLEHLRKAVKKIESNPSFKFALLFLDFDRFKRINDCLGHHIGDLFLKEIARRLSKSFDGNCPGCGGRHSHLVARLGGDEFTVLIDDIHSIEEVVKIADGLQATFSMPYQLQEHEVVSSASIGIVSSETHSRCADDLLKFADTAMYRAKHNGKACSVVFDEEMYDEIQASVRMEDDLREALDKNQFVLYYQPIISLNGAKLAGYEALIRWQHPHKGFLPPDQFIPLAEETGLILPMGEWVIREACRVLQLWQKQYPNIHPFISINLSKRQLSDPELVNTIGQILAETNIDPQRLKLEITETAIMEDIKTTVPTLKNLRELHLPLLMDDFGTGHSSLSRLNEFPIDGVKIDRAFVNSLTSNRQLGAIVQTIVTLAQTLNLDVVAEGVETEDQLAMLLALECGYAQGFYFAKPLPLEDAEERLAAESEQLSLAKKPQAKTPLNRQ